MQKAFSFSDHIASICEYNIGNEQQHSILILSSPVSLRAKIFAMEEKK